MKQSIPTLKIKELKKDWFESPKGFMELLDRYDKRYKKERTLGHAGSVTILRSIVKMIQMSSPHTDTWTRWVRDNLGTNVHPASARAFAEALNSMDNHTLYASHLLPLVIERPIVTLRQILRSEKILK